MGSGATHIEFSCDKPAAFVLADQRGRVTLHVTRDLKRCRKNVVNCENKSEEKRENRGAGREPRGEKMAFLSGFKQNLRENHNVAHTDRTVSMSSDREADNYKAA